MTSWSFFPEHFTRFARKKKANYILAKNIARTARSEYSRSRYVLSAEPKAEYLIILDIRKAESNKLFYYTL